MAEFTLRKTLLGYFLSPAASPPQSSLILTSPFFCPPSSLRPLWVALLLSLCLCLPSKGEVILCLCCCSCIHLPILLPHITPTSFYY